MRRMMGCLIVGVALGVLSPVPATAGEVVEEWQVRGIRAALKDGYPQVRALAAAELARLLKPELPDEPRREWRGQSANLLKEAQGDLRELLRDDDAEVRVKAARALARWYERDKDAAGVRELLGERESKAGWAVARPAAEALAHLYEQAKDAPALRGLLSYADDDVRAYARQSLTRLYEGARDVPALRELRQDADPLVRWDAARALARLGEPDGGSVMREALRDKEASPEVRLAAAEALAPSGDRDAVAALRELLKDSAPGTRAQAAEALARPAERARDAAALRGLLKSDSPEARREAAQALARLYEGDKDVKALQELLKNPDPDAYREAGWSLVRLLEAAKDTAALREIYKSPDPVARREAAWALGRLGEKDVVPDVLEYLRSSLPEPRRVSADVLARLGQADVPLVLALAYEDATLLYWARWQAHYWGGQKPEVARVLCAYLGRPEDDPVVPVSDDPGKSRRENALADVRVLREGAWEKTDSPWMKEDVAKWWSWVVTEELKDCETRDEAEELKKVRDALKDGTVGRRYVAGIDRVLEPYEISPSPLVRTLIVFVFLNLVALMLAQVGPRLGWKSRWLLLGAYLAGMLLVSFADVGRWDYRVHTIPWLLALISLGWLGLLSFACWIDFPAGWRQGLAPYAAKVASAVRDARDRASSEEYVALPADIRSDRAPTATPCADPADEILALLTGANGRKGSVCVESPAGTGKSALVREVVSRAVDQFKKSPVLRPLPVLLSGGGDTIEKRIESALAPLLPSPELLATWLEGGVFFLVLDGVSESGPAEAVLSNFVQGRYGRTTPLLIAGRPGRACAVAVQGSHWMTVEPKPLDEESLREFVTRYGGSTLPDPVKSACRGPDGKYLPSLVRMALVVNSRGDGPVSVADVYRGYFLKSLEGQFPAEGERIKRLEDASRWCLETYWRDGQRRRRYEPTDALQRQLRQAGILAAADNDPEPKDVLFADASMQTYLTAHALAAQDRQDYKQLPRPKDDPGTAPWDRGRVLLWAAANARFDGAELFRMCLATFTPKKGLRQGLLDGLLRWAEEHDEDLPRRKVLAAVAAPTADQVKDVHGAGKMLAAAARLSFAADEAQDSVEALGRLYAGVAPLVYEIEVGKSL